ncbi:MAG: S26 family signal peptidase [Prevotellaceae bacterium]|nr:S26 family signal peptidase [Prevotellaceae bacterium]
MKLLLKKTLKILWKTTRFLLAVTVLTIILKIFVMASFRIPSNSMLPTLETGDFVFVNKLTNVSHFPLSPCQIDDKEKH